MKGNVLIIAYEFKFWVEKKGLTMEQYQRREEVAIVSFHWIGEQLFPMFKSPFLVVSIDFGDFATLALCTQKLHNIG
jgi:hypothetical protein